MMRDVENSLLSSSGAVTLAQTVITRSSKPTVFLVGKHSFIF